MFEKLVQLNEFVKQHAGQAADVVQTASDALENLAAVIRKLEGGFFAEPEAGDVDAVLAECEANCQTAKGVLAGKSVVGAGVGSVDPATIALIIDLVLKVVELIRRRRQETP